MEKHPNPRVAGISAVVLVIVLGGVAYGFSQWNNTNLNTEVVAVVTPTPTPSPSIEPSKSPEVITTVSPSPVATANPYANWKTFKSAFGFSVRYPDAISSTGSMDWLKNVAWVAVETPRDNGSQENDPILSRTQFGTKQSFSGGYIWGISTYNPSLTSIEKQMAEQGSQFADRVAIQSSVKIDGVDATLLTVTTKSIPTFVSRTIHLERNGRIFLILNGAEEDGDMKTAFDEFYKSIRWTD